MVVLFADLGLLLVVISETYINRGIIICIYNNIAICESSNGNKQVQKKMRNSHLKCSCCTCSNWKRAITHSKMPDQTDVAIYAILHKIINKHTKFWEISFKMYSCRRRCTQKHFDQIFWVKRGINSFKNDPIKLMIDWCTSQTVVMIFDSSYGNKKTYKVLRNSLLKCTRSCAYKYLNEIFDVKKSNNSFKIIWPNCGNDMWFFISYI
jgi:hypothetical protein